jgi:two-component system, NtrC family, sensor kinase
MSFSLNLRILKVTSLYHACVMKKLLLFLLLLYSTATLHGQNTETDSLKRLLTITADSPKRVLILEGISYAYLSSYPDTSLLYALQGLQLAQKINDPIGEAYCINALGNVYFGVGDYPKALEMYLKSLEMKERLKNQERAIGVTYFNIANVYVEQQDYPHALQYVFKSKRVDELSRDSAGILFDLYSLGNIYSRMQKMDSALYYIRQAYNLAQRLQDENLIGAILNTTAEIYGEQNQVARAKDTYRQSIAYSQIVNDNEVLASDYFGLAKILKKQGELDSATIYGRRALLIAQEAPFLKVVLETSGFLAEVFKSKKQYDSALHYQELSTATKDSLYNVEKIKKVQNLRLLEQQRQQTIEVAKVQYRNKVKLYIVISASLIFLVTALLLWRNNRQKQKAFTLLEQQKKKTDLALEELTSTQKQLLHKEKMASLGELTAGIAHEIKNPLNFINNFSEVNNELIAELKNEVYFGHSKEITAIADDIRENNDKVILHGKRADSIVRNMLAHSRTASGEKQLIDINALVDEYLGLAFNGIRAKDNSFNANIETNFDESIGNINIVPQDIGRVLLNLFNNAFYAVAGKKKAADVSFQPKVDVNSKRVKDKIEITVTDNGTGITQQDLDKIFQPFFTTKPTGQGTGLGLSLSYDIIKAHSGELRVESIEGEGATFTISLPV